MLKFLWPLLIVSWRIPGLIWQRTAYFVQNNTTMVILPGDTRRTTSEFPCRTPATHFWRQIRSLETQNVFYLSLFTIWWGVWICKSLFVNIQYHLQREKLPDFSFPVNLHWRQDSKVFPTCWILIGQSKFSGALAVCKITITIRPSELVRGIWLQLVTSRKFHCVESFSVNQWQTSLPIIETETRNAC